jgi:hypothetical protein
MTRDDDGSRKHHISADELISDYLSDVLGGGDLSCPELTSKSKDNDQVATEEAAVKNSHYAHSAINEVKASVNYDQVCVKLAEDVISSTSTQVSHVHPAKIESGFYLIPTIKLYSTLEQQEIRNQTETLIVLFSNLYFLRRPLTPRVRQLFLDISEQNLDDFHAAKWLALAAQEAGG